MKQLSKEEMKKVIGGVIAPTCCEHGQLAHCYGTTSNCTNQAWGSCDGGSNCLEYCVVNQESQYWC